MDTDAQIKPRARTTDVLTSRLGDELVVYDTRSNRAHNLNGAAAAIFELSDGRRDIAAIVTAARSLGHRMSPDSVAEALDRLAGAGLLEGPYLQGWTGTRRSVMKKAAIGLAIPVVATLAFPLAAMASAGVACSRLKPCPPGFRCCLQDGDPFFHTCVPLLSPNCGIGN